MASSSQTSNANTSDQLGSHWKPKSFASCKTIKLRTLLRKAQYPFSTNDSRLLLIQKLHAVDRGALRYDAYSDEAILKLARDRSLLRTKRASAMISRQTAIRRLVQQDLHPRFDRFMELPPEIRVLVYSYYVAFFGETLRGPSPPPPAEACTKVRRELLPVLYSSPIIELELQRFRQASSSERYIRFTIGSGNFLKHLSSDNLNDIRRLQLTMTDPMAVSSTEMGVVVVCKAAFDLDRLGNAADILVSGNLGIKRFTENEGEARESKHDETQLALWNSLERLPVYHGKRRLTVSEVWTMRDVLSQLFA